MPSSPLSDFIYAKGEMAERTLLFDWSSTSIGAVSTWPACLLSTVNLILDSKFPMFIWWGKEKIQFYNDAYLEILGSGENSKHPSALGQTGDKCWAEIWPVISPLIEDVLRTGESIYLEDQLIPIYRKGRLDNVYWTFSYTPLRNSNGNPEGILVICTETTKTNQQIKENEDQLNRVLDHMAEGVGITDRDGRIIYANPMAHHILHTQGDLFPERKSNSSEWYNVHLDGRPMRDDEHPTIVAMAVGKPVFDYEFAIERPDSERIYLTMNAAPISDAEGKITGSVGMFTDITGRKKAEKALQESEKNLVSANIRLSLSEQTLQTAVQSANLGTWVISAETREIVPSARFKELFGFNSDEDLPLNAATNQIVEDYREGVIKAIHAAIDKGDNYEMEYPVVGFRDNKIRWVRATGKLYVPENGQAPYLSGTIADITEQRQNEQRKNDFISMVSHELKTPLTSTISYVQVSQKKAAANGDTVAEGMLKRAGLQLSKMTTLINGFLNISRLETGVIHIDKRHFDMAVLMKEVEESVFPDATSHKIVFAPVEETWVSIDKDKIEQVINNFISNANKYSPTKTTIRVACVTKGSYAYVSVKDEGIGIRQQDQQKLFDRYYRVDAVETMSISGFGIGLYICKEIVERHEGKIGVESVLGAGSTFWFTLPIVPQN
jgi:two-component system sensor histidine kinase VicK